MPTYLLVLDGKTISGHNDLDEAKAAASPHLGAETVSIELPAAPAPTTIWRYDPSDGQWVQIA